MRQVQQIPTTRRNDRRLGRPKRGEIPRWFRWQIIRFKFQAFELEIKIDNESNCNRKRQVQLDFRLH
jgi:hypothetical protein